MRIRLLFRERIDGMELAGLRDCYIHELKDLCSAEKQLVQALPKMAKAALARGRIPGHEVEDWLEGER